MAKITESNTDQGVARALNSETYGLYLLVLFLLASFYLIVNYVLTSSRDERNNARKNTMKGK